MVSFSARRIRCFRQRDAWDALADIEVFIFATEAELEAMEAERVISCGGFKFRSEHHLCSASRRDG
jgi:hypothetical protein